MDKNKFSTGVLGRRKIEYVKQEEPSFLKKLKEQAGYKEEDLTAKKRKREKPLPEDFEDLPDELPSVVIEPGSGISADEASAFIEKQSSTSASLATKKLSKSTKEPSGDGMDKIKFTKPDKKPDSETLSNKTSSRTTKKAESKQSSSKPAKTASAVKNASLLSFDEEEDDD